MTPFHLKGAHMTVVAMSQVSFHGTIRCVILI